VTIINFLFQRTMKLSDVTVWFRHASSRQLTLSGNIITSNKWICGSADEIFVLTKEFVGGVVFKMTCNLLLQCSNPTDCVIQIVILFHDIKGEMKLYGYKFSVYVREMI